MADDFAAIEALMAAGPAHVYGGDPDDPRNLERGPPGEPTAAGGALRAFGQFFVEVRAGWFVRVDHRTSIPPAWLSRPWYFAVRADGCWYVGPPAEPLVTGTKAHGRALAAVRKWMADSDVTDVRKMPPETIDRLWTEAAKPRKRKTSGGRPTTPS